MTAANAFVEFWRARAARRSNRPPIRSYRRPIPPRLPAVVATAALLGGLATGCADAPPKPADYVEVIPPARAKADLLGIGPSVPEDKGLLVGPNFGLRARQVSAEQEIPKSFAEWLRVEPFRAADGHELLMLSVTAEPQWENGRWEEKGETPKAAIVVGGRTTNLKEVPKSGSLIMASVPKGGTGTLSVTDQGRTQSLDLRTGIRQADAAGPILTHQQLDADYHESGRVRGYGPGRTLDVQVKISSASLEPYFPGLGWAKPGRGWLRLDVSQAYSDGMNNRAELGEAYVIFFLDPAKTFRLTWAGGSARPLRGRAFNTVNPAARYAAIFDLPASFRTGRLTIAPDGPLFTFRGDSSTAEIFGLGRVPDCGGRVVCLTWQGRPEPQVVNVALT